MKKLFLISLFSSLLFSASSEQIEQYLSISKADAQLVSIEQVFDSMRQNQEREDNNSQEINQIYRKYLEEHLSSNELEELLALYRTPIMQRYVVEMESSISKEDMSAFLKDLEENPLTTERLDIVDNILKLTVKEDEILAFYKSMTQRYRKASKKSDNNQTIKPTKQEQQYVEMVKEGTKNELLYGLQVLSIEEMKELKSALESAVISKASKIESEAMIHVMNQFIQGITSKPQAKVQETNSTL
jgi:hypothetical protein